MALLTNQAEDPSQTTFLRNVFASAAKKKFATLQKALQEIIVEEDVFGLITNRKPGPRAFAYPRSADKVAAFMTWFRQETQDTVLQVSQVENVGTSVDGAWTNKFVKAAYERGITKARNQIRVEESLLVNGVVVFAKARKGRGKRTPPLAKTGGVEASLNMPAHIERLSMLYSRTFSELKGITDAMDKLISQTLAEGIVNGDSPRTLARKLNKVITGAGGELGTTDSLGRFIPSQRRAELLARTEIIRAHAEAQLTEFKQWGVAGVKAKAEILTTKDKRTCPKCMQLEKAVYTIDEARGVIPVHPACRCIWVPFIEKAK
jgi:SPP1 gp7 family putative phage head morphogenesis protein